MKITWTIMEMTMLAIRQADMRCFCIALRWAMRKKFPNNMKEWEQEHQEKLVDVINELHKRKNVDMVCSLNEGE